jgi:hypothetical protein
MVGTSGTATTGSKVWYLAAGQKKVGPLATSRVLERVAQGKVPTEARVWRDGMDDWLPIHQVAEFQVEATILRESAQGSQSDVETAALPEPEPEAPAKPVKKARVGSGVGAAVAERPRAAPASKARARAAERPAAEVAFEPPHRIERRDLWRAFGFGLDRRRVTIVLGAVVMAGLAFALVSVVGVVAGKLHALLQLPFVLGASLASFAVTSIGLGALSRHSRRQLEEGAPPTLAEAFGYALRHAAALVVPPVVLSVAWLAPLVALVLLTLLIKIPYLGPIGTGALFGVHLALSALTLYLMVTAGIASAFAPIVVGFEGTGVVATLRALLDFARRSTARAFLWSILPGLAFVPFTGAVLLVTTLVLALPLGAVTAVVGADLFAWVKSGMVGDAPVSGLLIGAVPMVLWIGLAISAALAVLASVSNSLLAHLYVAGRPGNDARPTRDAWIAARTLKVGEN